MTGLLDTEPEHLLHQDSTAGLLILDFSAKRCLVLTYRSEQRHLNLFTGQNSENNVILTSKINESASSHNCGPMQWRSQSLSLRCTRFPKESLAQEKDILAKHLVRNSIEVRKERLLGNREERPHNRSSSDCVSQKICPGFEILYKRITHLRKKKNENLCPGWGI